MSDQFDKDVAARLKLLREKEYSDRVKAEAERHLKAGTPERVTS
jgi:hypothetical protein